MRKYLFVSALFVLIASFSVAQSSFALDWGIPALVQSSELLPQDNLSESYLVSDSEDQFPELMTVQSITEPSPAGCQGQTDYAHKSGNESSVHGRTTCNFPVNSVSVTSHLMNQQWWGWNELNSGTSTRAYSNNSQDATPHSPCSTTSINNFYGWSSHESVENGKTYSASTRSPDQQFGC